MSDIRQEPIEEGSGPVFQPDTLLPTQFFAKLRQKAFVEGEKRLMAAVLSDAVDSYMKLAFATEPRSRQVYLDSESWIFQNESGPWFFSFLNICDVLGLDPDYIRDGLLKWKDRKQPMLRAADAFRRAPRTARAGEERDRGEMKKAG